METAFSLCQPSCSTRFRFKAKLDPQKARQRSRSPTRVCQQGEATCPRRRRNKRHRSSRSPSPYESPPVSPRTAFRESLFDALADDEGAAYWEGVYGQPIHIYSSYKNPEEGGCVGSGLDSDGNPVLEKMTDDEYASYVRARMWERSHAYIIEERVKRDKAKQEFHRARKQLESDEAERTFLETKRLEAAARRKVQQQQQDFEKAWARYCNGWEMLKKAAHLTNVCDAMQSCAKQGNGQPVKKMHLPWPTVSGNQEDISKENVGLFFRKAALNMCEPLGVEHEVSSNLFSIVKAERIKWHPDKIVQFYSIITKSDVEGVTAVFQVMDELFRSLILRE